MARPPKPFVPPTPKLQPPTFPVPKKAAEEIDALLMTDEQYSENLPVTLEGLLALDKSVITESQLNILDRKIAKLKKDKAVVADDASMREKPEPTAEERIRISRSILKEPIPTGLRIFEAPDGFCMYGEATETQAWYRRGGADGKGMWINPAR